MNDFQTFEERLVSHLYSSFPESQEISTEELVVTVQTLIEKAMGYGFETEGDIAIYVITAYLLGINFDTEFPAAAETLADSSYTVTEKADWLQTFTQQIFEALESDQAPQTEEKQQPIVQEADMTTYLSMQADAQVFHELADWIVQQLILGDASGFIDNFSPNFLQKTGLAAVEQVCAEMFLPFFAGAYAIGHSKTITQTTDTFGNTGFAFYQHIVSDKGEKPFIIYMVDEDNRIVIANLIVNKTYEDMH